MAKMPSSKVIAGKSGKSSGCKVAAPVTRMSVTNAKGAEKSVDVRKIDNGFIIRESVYSPKKGYTSTERYSATAPTLKVDAPKK